MNHEVLTSALYYYAMASAKIEDVPMGYRAPTWTELDLRMPEESERWRCAVDAFLASLGAPPGRHEEIIFDGVLVSAPPTTKGAPGGGERRRRVTPDDN